jgi:hypothetical protein
MGLCIVDNGSGAGACRENMVNVLAERSIVDQTSAIREAVLAYQSADFGLGKADAKCAKAGAEL